jgi:arylformamidase
MIAKIKSGSESLEVDLSKPLDVSLPLKNGNENPNAWQAPHVKIEPVKMGDWIGEVKSGAPVNFRNIFFNPHGNGTHTESVGHISKEDFFINDCLKKFFFLAELISIEPKLISKGERVILREQIIGKMKHKNTEALLIRTLPNDLLKRKKNYTETNSPYLHHEAAEFIRRKGIKHLLVDLPSVDKEHDGGKLLAHHVFWNYPAKPLTDATITELIFVPDEIKDGKYFLNIQIANFENDASPSKILLFKIR